MKFKKWYLLLCIIPILCVYLLYTPKVKLTGEMVRLDLTATQNTFYIEEEEYSTTMLQTVQPYLASYQKDGYFDSEDGIQIYYQTYVLPNAKGNITISHGFTESLNKYEEVIYYFLQSGYSVFIMDHRGHGYSTRDVEDPSLVTLDDFSSYVTDFSNFMTNIVLPTIGDEPSYLYAHSMGGGIGAAVIEEYPEYFDKVVLSSPMLSIKTGMPIKVAKLISWFAVQFGQGERYLPGHFAFDGIRDISASSASSPARYNYIFDKLLANETYQTYGGSFAWLKQCLAGTTKILKDENLSKITVPVLVFQSELDALVEPEGQYKFVNNVASSQLVFVENTKHELFSTSNEVMIPYFNTIFDFLNK